MVPEDRSVVLFAASVAQMDPTFVRGLSASWGKMVQNIE